VSAVYACCLSCRATHTVSRWEDDPLCVACSMAADSRAAREKRARKLEDLWEGVEPIPVAEVFPGLARQLGLDR
jgi:hypothetical protein